MKTRAAVAWKAGAPLTIEDVDLQGPRDGEVLVEVKATGICHTDGDWPGYSLDAERQRMLQWPAHLRSCLTMLLYLNGPDDGVQGGDTRLYRPDGSSHDVRPTKGSALFFRHGFGPPSVLHVGGPVRGAVSKYVARINVMYAAATP